MLLLAALSATLLILSPDPKGAACHLSPKQTSGPKARAVLAQFGGQRGPSEEDKEKARLRMGITKDQQAQIEKLFKDSEQKMRDLRTEMRGLYTELYDNIYGQYEIDHARANEVRKRILDLHRRMGDIHAHNEEMLRKILNHDQFEKMRALMRERR